ncbi:MAG: peptidylprolyl isomerase [Ruminococcus sp.]|nr:peptidylprolyl isomerase [Ruminococcus sp.]
MDKKKFLKIAFYGMLVLTVITIMMTIVAAYDQKNTIRIDPDDVVLVQLDTIKGNIDPDAEVAVIKTSLGEIKAELYTEYAPKTVARFKELAESGYYNGTYVYEVQKDMFFSGGSPYSDGSLEDGYDEESEKIEQELHQNIWPFKGAFMSCGLTRNSFFTGEQIVYGGSRFMVAGSIEFTDEIKTELLEGKENTHIEDAFIEYGGLPNASQQMTIFAQAYDGFDVLENIMKLESDEETFRPFDEFKIEEIKICTYKEAPKSQADESIKK